MTRAPTRILCLATTFGSAPVLAVGDAMVLRSIEARIAELTMAGIAMLVPSSRELCEGKRERRATQEEIRALETERAQSAKPRRRIGLVPGWRSGLTIGWIDRAGGIVTRFRAWRLLAPIFHEPATEAPLDKQVVTQAQERSK